MIPSKAYINLFERSEADQWFIDRRPVVVSPCCHGDDEAAVYAELCQIVEEWLDAMKRDGKPLPEPTAGKDVASMIG